MSELPKGWVTTQISDLSIKCKQRKPDDDEEIIYIDIGSIDRTLKKIASPQTLLGKNAPSRARKIVEKGDILVSLTRPNLNAVALVPEELDGQFASTGFEVVKPIGVENRYIFALVRSQVFINGITKKVQGALYPAAKSIDVRTYKFPLPPLNEQIRIANKLDSLLAKVEATQKHLDKIPTLLKRFRQSVLAAAVSGELTKEWRGVNKVNISEWRLISLQTVAKILDPQPSHRTPKEVEGGVPYIGIGDLKKDGSIDFKNSRKVSPDVLQEHKKRYTLKKGDFVFGKIGTLGKATVLPVNIDYTLSANVILIQPNSEFSNPTYLMFFLSAPLTMKEIANQANSTSQAAFGIKKMRAFICHIPSLEEQKQIVKRVEALFALADKVEQQYHAAKQRTDRLTQSILAKAFCGELVSQDPNDEPASELLKRIQADKT